MSSRVMGQVSGKAVVENKQTLRRQVRGALMRLQRLTNKLKQLFHEPNVTTYSISVACDRAGLVSVFGVRGQLSFGGERY